MLAFTQYVWPEFQANWHHEAIAECLDEWVNDDIQNLMIFSPAQHGKSELVSRKLPAFILGQYPDAKVMAASYAAELIQNMNRDVQRTMEQPEYIKLFPETRLNSKNIRTVTGSYLRNNDIFEIVGRRGSYRCAGIGGGLAGFPLDFGIIDDAYKDYKEASSKTIREGVWEWYTSVFLRRCHSKSKQLITTTRWHPDDLPGRLLEREGHRWKVLKLQGIREEVRNEQPKKYFDLTPRFEKRAIGEALWPSRFDADTLERQRELNSHQFQALTQQDPRPREGGMFPREKFGIPLAAAPVGWKAIVRYWDKAGAAEGKGDFTVGVLMAIYADGSYVIIDVKRFQKKAHERNTIMVQTAESDKHRYGNVKIWIESPPGLAKEATDTVIKLMAGFTVAGDHVRGDKVERAEPFASQVQAGNVRIVRGDWNEDWFTELEGAPEGVNDDQWDAGAGAFNKLTSKSGGTFALNHTR